ncbi:peroxide stress protein YaaA [Corynebacterium sp. TA-R-1]|uniref:Peroxide stress protein YaaA n=1 Tax=Corynebacterium stercoris TaxID=2943490 RepID=A0ABT1FXX1_9CORY|nr:peroxide stress protein YaaA [Corynebacterium stercoris]MCP1386599.1 peroxide stress protein YaaA [Corynebacterium stercoris]
MLIVLPPSETKAPGGEPDGLACSFPALNPVRTSLLDALSSSPVERMMAELKIPVGKRAEAEENLHLRTAPVMPAIFRYTGVLYDALDASSLSDDSLQHLAIGSALFGLVRAGDMIPRYRVSGGSKLAGRTMRSWWGTSVSEALAGAAEEHGLIVDLRSGAYQQLGPVPAGVPCATVRVENVLADGTRKVVSHFNKHYKGELARDLALLAGREGGAPGVRDADELADAASEAGFDVEVRGDELTLLVSAQR